jgi:hypothetical protein
MAQTKNRQSLAKVTAKHAARVASHRLISDKVGGGTLIGKLLRTLSSHAITKISNIKK